MNLKNQIIRIAQENPELRKDLVPLLRKNATPKYEDYLKRKQKEREKPLTREEWERKVLHKKEKPVEEQKKLPKLPEDHPIRRISEDFKLYQLVNGLGLPNSPGKPCSDGSRQQSPHTGPTLRAVKIPGLVSSLPE